MNILMSFDRNFLTRAETMLFSLRENVSEGIVVYLINKRLTDEELERFRKYLQKLRMELSVITVGETVFDHMTLGIGNFTTETYYRIIAPCILPDDLDRIFWLDADMLINGDISKIYHSDLKGNMLLVIPSAAKGKGTANKRAMGMDVNAPYFNAGVLLMDLTKLRGFMSVEEYSEVCEKLNDVILFPDQDILNYLFSDKALFVDEIYNYQLTILDHPDRMQEAYILHYISNAKPWSYKCSYKLARPYFKALLRQGRPLSALKILLLRPVHMVYAAYRKIKHGSRT